MLLFVIALYLFINNNIYKKNNQSVRNIIGELNRKLLKNPNDYNTIYKLALIKDENGDILDALKNMSFLYMLIILMIMKKLKYIKEWKTYALN